MSKLFYISFVLAIILFTVNDKLLAVNYSTRNGGRTFHINYGNQIITQPSSASSSMYAKMLDIIDSQYPKDYEPLVFGDADHDGKIEMYRGIWNIDNQFTRVYEFDANMNYTITDLPYWSAPWAIGDIDGNGLTDLVVQDGDSGMPWDGNGYLRIYESPNVNSYPTNLKTQVILPGRKIDYYARITDADKDGKKEVLLSANCYCYENHMQIYEWENNSLTLKWTQPDIYGVTLKKAIADFDMDGKIEIAAIDWESCVAYVYENTGNDAYTLIQSWSLPSFSWPNVIEETNPDGGNPELAITIAYESGTKTQYECRIYKETNNNFTQWWVSSFPPKEGPIYAMGTTGDYDKDGYDEILISDYNTLKLLKFNGSQMAVTWMKTEFAPIYLTSCDMRMDGLMNFMDIIWGDYIDTIRFWNFAVSSEASVNWNMLSVPIVVWDFTKSAVWTGANSSAYTWEGGPLYVAKDPVANRIGYWVEYHPAQSVTYVGVPKDSFHISVTTGWNMIGSLYSDIPTSKIIPVGASFISDFFGYSNTYFYTDTIKAGQGYWIKVNCPGTLIMDKNATPGGGGQPCSEQPPNPAEAPQPPILASPVNGSTDVSYEPALTWNSSTGAISYSLQGSTNECFTTLAFNYSGLTATSKQVGPLSYHTTYYWRVNASNTSATSNWSSTWSFTTENAPPTDPCDTYSSMKPLDEFTVSDAKGTSQKLYVGNGDRGFAFPFSDFELPPITPKGVFNARFNSGKFIESVPPGKGLNKLTIKIKDAVLPLTLSWVVKEPNKITYWISKPGKNNAAIKLSGTGNTVVESSKDGDLIIIAKAIDPCKEQKAAIGGEQLDDLLTTPIKYALEQNNPNPFNPNTVIEYSLPEAAYVVLKVYNILGEEVQTLVNETQDVGYKAVRFDASSLPSGVYLYKLTAGAFTDLKKMILIR